jgi:RNA polymerase sigma-54 factor
LAGGDEAGFGRSPERGVAGEGGFGRSLGRTITPPFGRRSGAPAGDGSAGPTGEGPMAKLSLAARTELRVSPAQIGLARLLALPTVALHQTVREELAANPALDEIETSRRCALCDGPVLAGSCLRCREGATDRVAAEAQTLLVPAPRSLADALLTDLRASLPPGEHRVAAALVGSLDERGFLTEAPDAIAADLAVAPARVDVALALLRELGPPGIAARDARACLIAQLDALATSGTSHPYARAIVSAHLEDLGGRRYRAIARELGIGVAEVERAHAFIRDRLWPYPAAAVGTAGDESSRRVYRVPDLAIRSLAAGFGVELVQSTQRWLRLNPIYQELARRPVALSTDERAHVLACLARAQTFLQTLRRREQTLLRVGRAAVEHQSAFVRDGDRHRVLLTRQRVADKLGLHESTVSRAVADKTVELPDGALRPLSDFFDGARGARDALRDILAREDVPLTDDELAALLTARGFPVARRTVAKYRAQLHILPHYARSPGSGVR